MAKEKTTYRITNINGDVWQRHADELTFGHFGDDIEVATLLVDKKEKYIYPLRNICEIAINPTNCRNASSG